eukprot:6104959-Alexandrium_andersonii.AAC.1
MAGSLALATAEAKSEENSFTESPSKGMASFCARARSAFVTGTIHSRWEPSGARGTVSSCLLFSDSRACVEGKKTTE